MLCGSTAAKATSRFSPSVEWVGGPPVGPSPTDLQGYPGRRACYGLFRKTATYSTNSEAREPPLHPAPAPAPSWAAIGEGVLHLGQRGRASRAHRDIQNLGFLQRYEGCSVQCTKHRHTGFDSVSVCRRTVKLLYLYIPNEVWSSRDAPDRQGGSGHT